MKQNEINCQLLNHKVVKIYAFDLTELLCKDMQNYESQVGIDQTV